MKCRLCEFTTNRMRLLRKHWNSEHPKSFTSIQKWIHESTDELLLEAQRLANEGMKGYKAK